MVTVSAIPKIKILKGEDSASATVSSPGNSTYAESTGSVMFDVFLLFQAQDSTKFVSISNPPLLTSKLVEG